MGRIDGHRYGPLTLQDQARLGYGMGLTGEPQPGAVNADQFDALWLRAGRGSGYPLPARRAIRRWAARCRPIRRRRSWSRSEPVVSEKSMNRTPSWRANSCSWLGAKPRPASRTLS